VIFFVSVPYILSSAQNIEKNECIVKHPQVIVSGTIEHHNNGFVFYKTPRYCLYFRGEMKITGDECKVLTYVTESEYERQMYNK
jgi:hypothetical protein